MWSTPSGVRSLKGAGQAQGGLTQAKDSDTRGERVLWTSVMQGALVFGGAITSQPLPSNLFLAHHGLSYEGLPLLHGPSFLHLHVHKKPALGFLSFSPVLLPPSGSLVPLSGGAVCLCPLVAPLRQVGILPIRLGELQLAAASFDLPPALLRASLEKHSLQLSVGRSTTLPHCLGLSGELSGSRVSLQGESTVPLLQPGSELPGKPPLLWDQCRSLHLCRLSSVAASEHSLLSRLSSLPPPRSGVVGPGASTSQ